MLSDEEKADATKFAATLRQHGEHHSFRGNHSLADNLLGGAKLLERMATLKEPPRPVTPLVCPKCYTLWLFWPKEQCAAQHDALNMRGSKSCSYCEPAGVADLKGMGAYPPDVTKL